MQICRKGTREKCSVLFGCTPCVLIIVVFSTHQLLHVAFSWIWNQNDSLETIKGPKLQNLFSQEIQGHTNIDKVTTHLKVRSQNQLKSLLRSWWLLFLPSLFSLLKHSFFSFKQLIITGEMVRLGRFECSVPTAKTTIGFSFEVSSVQGYGMNCYNLLFFQCFLMISYHPKTNKRINMPKIDKVKIQNWEKKIDKIS